MPDPPPYIKTLEYLYSLEPLGIRMGLRRIKALLKGLGNPQDRFPIIHVAGTNGKGSTSAMLSSILTKAGYRVGLYTSPHLERFTERIKINDREIAEERVVELVERVEERGRRGSGVRCQKKRQFLNLRPPTPDPRLSSPTFFEFTTALAFLYFAEEEVDIAILEVGLGGRLDATNVGNPIVSVITNVTREHEDILGKGVTTIAREKAGIVGRKGILVTTERKPIVLNVLEEACREKRATLYRLGRDFSINVSDCSFSFYGRRWRVKGLSTNLLGRHQLINAAGALAALEVVVEKGYSIGERAIRLGLRDVRWSGRFEVVSQNPLIVLDCAHNPGGARVLKEALIQSSKFKVQSSKRRLFLILGMMRDKDIRGFARLLAPLAYQTILTIPKTPRAAQPSLLLSKVNPYAKRIKIIGDIKDACQYAVSKARLDDIILVTGSIFTVGEARGFLMARL